MPASTKVSDAPADDARHQPAPPPTTLPHAANPATRPSSAPRIRPEPAPRLLPIPIPDGREPWVGALVALVAFLVLWRACDWNGPPRYDGAGYAILAKSLVERRGYREISHPEQPPHDHFPPGYPILLAAWWSAFGGPDNHSARVLSVLCASLAAPVWWLAFRHIHGPRVALLLALALALNWSWARIGGQIRAEPLYLLLQGLAFGVALRIEAAPLHSLRQESFRVMLLGGLLAWCLLTRQIAAPLVAAVLLRMALRRAGPPVDRLRWTLLALGVVALFVAPWIAWLLVVRRRPQWELLPLDPASLAALVPAQALFYLRRIPDQVFGPWVERATVFSGNAPILAPAATLLAAAFTAVVLLGWLRLARDPRRALAGIVPLATLALLLVWPFTEAGRFLVPLVPFILMGAVEGAAALAAALHLRRHPRADTATPARLPRSFALARTAAAAALLLLGLPVAVRTLAQDPAARERAGHASFDDACQWIRQEAIQSGPVLARHGGDVHWLTGRLALEPRADDPETILADIDRHGVAYVLVDRARYANAPPSPLERLIRTRPERFERVWPPPHSESESETPDSPTPDVEIHRVRPGPRFTPPLPSPRHPVPAPQPPESNPVEPGTRSAPDLPLKTLAAR